MNRHLIQRIAPALAVIVSGCTVIPAYQPPEPAVPAQWQATLPHGGNNSELLGWWSQFNDPLLAELQAAAEHDNPTLEKAAAAIREARANITVTRAAGWPAVNGNAASTQNSTRTRGMTERSTANSAGLDASWEVDLFGRVRYGVEAAQATAEASVGQWHAARISLAAEVASDYVSYRACGQQVQAYRAELASQQETARITDVLVKAGFNATSDANLAQASVASASASLTEQQASCDVTVKALVALTGLDEAALRARLDAGPGAIPRPAAFAVAAVPASLVSQRPDVMSAERNVAAAYAGIGSAEASRYPTLSLLGTLTLSAAAGVSTTAWSFGPSLTAPLFDAGKRKAGAEAARAVYDQAVAGYQGTVRSAVQEIETALVRLDSAARREADARAAAANYRAYLTSSETLWRAGSMSLLDLETARRASITADLNLIALERDQVNNWIALYKALGGGWQSVPADPIAKETPQP